MKLKAHETGLALGTMVAALHAVWSLLVWAGLAKPFMDWILMLHFLTNPYRVLPFDLVSSLTLIVVTFVVGYLFGWVFANIWNRVAKKS